MNFLPTSGHGGKTQLTLQGSGFHISAGTTSQIYVITLGLKYDSMI